MGRLVIDGNSVYEIDEDCVQRKGEWERQKNNDRRENDSQGAIKDRRIRTQYP